MKGFKLQISGVGNDHSENCATTNVSNYLVGIFSDEKSKSHPSIRLSPSLLSSTISQLCSHQIEPKSSSPQLINFDPFLFNHRKHSLTS